MIDAIKAAATEPVVTWMGLTQPQESNLTILLHRLLATRPRDRCQMAPAWRAIFPCDEQRDEAMAALELLRVQLAMRGMCPPEIRIAEARAHLGIEEERAAKEYASE